MENKKAIILSIASFFAGAITGGTSMFFYLNKKHKKDIENFVEKKMDSIIQNYQNIGNNEVIELQKEKNNLPELIKQDKDKFEKEFNSEYEEEITSFKEKPKRHRRVESLFGDYKQPTPEQKGKPQAFHPEDEEDKEKYYGPNFPREQDINEGVEETLDYMDSNNQYDEDLDSDLIQRDEDGIVRPYTFTKEEFDDCYENSNEYEKETLYWYEGNGILVQNDRHIEGNSPEDESILDDNDKIYYTIGDAAERFGENEDEPDKVYVKNEDFHMLYEVIKIDDEYVPA